MAPRATTKPALDPLADLREPTPAAAPATTQEAQEPAQDGPVAPTGYQVTLDGPGAIQAAVKALHGNRHVANTVHKGGTCPCSALAATVLDGVLNHITVTVQENSDDDGEGGASA